MSTEEKHFNTVNVFTMYKFSFVSTENGISKTLMNLMTTDLKSLSTLETNKHNYFHLPCQELNSLAQNFPRLWSMHSASFGGKTSTV